MAHSYDQNLQISSDFTYQQYAAPLVPQNIDISGTAPGGSVTTIDGDSGGGAVGPIVTFGGGATGYSFQAVGTSVTMVGNTATILAALGLSKNGSGVVAPTITDDSSQGYSVNSLFTDTALDDGYMCMDATVGAAVWKKVTP